MGPGGRSDVMLGSKYEKKSNFNSTIEFPVRNLVKMQIFEFLLLFLEELDIKPYFLKIVNISGGNNIQ